MNLASSRATDPDVPADSKAVVEVIIVRDTWLAAVKAGDIGGLLSLVTDDGVMMHPKRTVSGKDALRADLETSFRQYRVVDETVTSNETVTAGAWAFDRGRAQTTVVPVIGGEPTEIESEVVTILHRESDGKWKIARTIAVLR
jgi:uncharacterized protein (TIGR02246 family)